MGFLGALGGAVIDADAVSRSLTAPGGAAIPAIQAAFGPEALDSLGGMDRAAMRTRVFSDPAARLRLESLVHPLIWQEIGLQRQAALSEGPAFLVFDVPLLVEMRRWRPMLDTIVVVDCGPTTQHERVLARNGMDAGQTQRIMDAKLAFTPGPNTSGGRTITTSMPVFTSISRNPSSASNLEIP